jgi:predicted transcriptional regulator
MSSWKRGFLEIIAEILESLMERPLKKTHITFRCNLDSRAVTRYLSIIMYVGLVERSKEDSSYYSITQKGVSYRNQFRSFMSLMEKDLEKLDLKNSDTKELLAELNTRRH